MRTFKGTASIDFKLIVPEQFLEQLRKDAVSEDTTITTPFLKMAQARHPDKDDEFLALVLSNGIRLNMRSELLNLLAQGAIGGTVSPAKIDVIAAVLDHDAPTTPDVIHYKRAEGGAVVPAKQGGNASVAFVGFLLMLGFAVACAAGWVLNIVHLIRHTQADVFGLQVILELLGIFVFPLGILLGWIG